jgi:hypothetical protein
VSGLIEAFAPKLATWIAHGEVVVAPNTVIHARDYLVFDVEHKVIATSEVREPSAAVAMALKASDC